MKISLEEITSIFPEGVPAEALLVLQGDETNEQKKEKLKKLRKKDELLFRMSNVSRNIPDNWTIEGESVKKFFEEVYDYLKNDEKRIRQVEEAFKEGWISRHDSSYPFTTKDDLEKQTKNYINSIF